MASTFDAERNGGVAAGGGGRTETSGAESVLAMVHPLSFARSNGRAYHVRVGMARGLPGVALLGTRVLNASQGLPPARGEGVACE